MPLWRVEVSIDSVSTALPAANLFPTQQASYAGASYALTAVTGAGFTTNYLVVKLNIIHNRQLHPNQANRYLSRMSAALSPGSGGDPYYFAVFDGPTNLTVTSDIDALDDGTAFGAGGVLAIEKNTATGDLRFITPMGTISTTCTNEGVQQSSQMRPASIGLLLQALDAVPANSANQSLQVDFSHIAEYQDAVFMAGAAMSATDPGMWSDWNESAIFSSLIGPTFTQQTTHERAVLLYTANSPASGSNIDDGWYRLFQGADHMPAPLPLDLTVYEPTNTLFGAWQRMPTDLVARRSQDARVWIDSMVEETTVAESISVQTFAGEFWIAYFDGSRIVTQKSGDFGDTWSAAMPVPITGTNPRLVISPEGVQFYFYLTGGNLVLSRSYDFGATIADASPIVVANAVTAQDFGAVLDQARRLVVSFIVLGNWISRVSDDWGETWQDA